MTCTVAVWSSRRAEEPNDLDTNGEGALIDRLAAPRRGRNARDAIVRGVGGNGLEMMELVQVAGAYVEVAKRSLLRVAAQYQRQ